VTRLDHGPHDGGSLLPCRIAIGRANAKTSSRAGRVSFLIAATSGSLAAKSTRGQFNELTRAGILKARSLDSTRLGGAIELFMKRPEGAEPVTFCISMSPTQSEPRGCAA
jgi:hypothetical protein